MVLKKDLKKEVRLMNDKKMNKLCKYLYLIYSHLNKCIRARPATAET